MPSSWTFYPNSFWSASFYWTPAVHSGQLLLIFLMKKWKSHLAGLSCIPFVSHADMKLHSNPIMEIESKGSKMGESVWLIIGLDILQTFLKQYDHTWWTFFTLYVQKSSALRKLVETVWVSSYLFPLEVVNFFSWRISMIPNCSLTSLLKKDIPLFLPTGFPKVTETFPGIFWFFSD